MLDTPVLSPVGHEPAASADLERFLVQVSALCAPAVPVLVSVACVSAVGSCWEAYGAVSLRSPCEARQVWRRGARLRVRVKPPDTWEQSTAWTGTFGACMSVVARACCQERAQFFAPRALSLHEIASSAFIGGKHRLFAHRWPL